MRVTMVQATNLGTSCPAQWEAVDDFGEHWYARYRHGFLSVDIRGNYSVPSFFGRRVGDDLDGCMTYDELKRHTAGCISWPEDQGWGEP